MGFEDIKAERRIMASLDAPHDDVTLPERPDDAALLDLPASVQTRRDESLSAERLQAMRRRARVAGSLSRDDALMLIRAIGRQREIIRSLEATRALVDAACLAACSDNDAATVGPDACDPEAGRYLCLNENGDPLIDTNDPDEVVRALSDLWGLVSEKGEALEVSLADAQAEVQRLQELAALWEAVRLRFAVSQVSIGVPCTRFEVTVQGEYRSLEEYARTHLGAGPGGSLPPDAGWGGSPQLCQTTDEVPVSGRPARDAGAEVGASARPSLPLTRFRHGQRVRLIHTVSMPAVLVGRTGTVHRVRHADARAWVRMDTPLPSRLQSFPNGDDRERYLLLEPQECTDA